VAPDQQGVGDGVGDFELDGEAHATEGGFGTSVPEGVDCAAFEEAVKAEVARMMKEKEAELEARKKEVLADTMEEKMTDMLVRSVIKAMDAKDTYRKVNSPPPATESTVIINGMEFRTAPRSKDELKDGEVLISKVDRYNLDKTSKEKLRTKACASLETKFEKMKIAKLVDGSGEEDLGKLILAQQTTAESFEKWAMSYDVNGIFLMPDTDDFSDRMAMANAPKINLLNDYKRVKSDRVFKWQAAVKSLLPGTDVESSSWACSKLESSTEANLKLQVKQSLSRLPEVQRGGVSFWFVLATALDANDHEHKRLVVKYIENHCLADTKNEDVSLSSMCFVAAARSLRSADVPSDTIKIYLNSMLKSSCEDFNRVVSAVLGHFHAVGFSGDGVEILEHLGVVSDKLVAISTSLWRKGRSGRLP
jgi:phosphotransferase system IIA component